MSSMRRANWAIMDSGAWAVVVVDDTSGRADNGIDTGVTSGKADDEEKEGASVVVEADEGVRS